MRAGTERRERESGADVAFVRIHRGVGQENLFNVVKAYSLYDEEVGYCQGEPARCSDLLWAPLTPRRMRIQACNSSSVLSSSTCQTKRPSRLSSG